MNYLISFLEGIITFISPCLLPMLPIYILYFAGGTDGDNKKAKTVRNALGFVLGFTLVFISMGAFAGVIGSFFVEYQNIINIVAGAVIVAFGLNFLGVLKFSFGGHGKNREVKDLGFISSLMLGIAFSISWTPCVGVFLGSALVLASQQGSVMTGILMLLAYSLGLGIPFLASAILIDKLKSVFDFIKRNYRVINTVSGSLLILMGVLMMTGVMGRILALLSF